MTEAQENLALARQDAEQDVARLKARLVATEQELALLDEQVTPIAVELLEKHFGHGRLLLQTAYENLRLLTTATEACSDTCD
jgi:hypothetical protein